MWKFFLLIGLVGKLIAGKTIIIGDSMFAGGSTIPNWLEQWSGREIENFAKVGASLKEGWVKSIPDQYWEYPNKSILSTVIMDGGGNDVFSSRSDCLMVNQKCLNVIHDSLSKLDSLFGKMIEDNVDQVIYLGFYYAKGLNRAVDIGMEKLKEICQEDGDLPCFLVDPRNYSLSLGWDGVHPTSEGYLRLATGIWDTVIAHDIEI